MEQPSAFPHRTGRSEPFDCCPRGAARASDVHGSSTSSRQVGDDFPREPETHLFHDNRHVQRAANFADVIQRVAKRRLAVGLQGFLERIGMQGEKVRLYHLHGTPTHSHCIAI